MDQEPRLPGLVPGPPYFFGLRSGGKLALGSSGSELYLTVGDQGYDGWLLEEMVSQDETADYGKVIRIDLATRLGQIYSLGHRNPQGLYIDPEGNIWSTEHGPKGGDELNRIVAGANYGWPLVTYGTEYEAKSWPLARSRGDHSGFVRPIFSWVPSVGMTAVIGIERGLFPDWRGDLLVSSLAGLSLWRVRVREGRVLLAEPMRLAERMRDLVEGADGRILIWNASGSVTVLQPIEASAFAGDGNLGGEVLVAGCLGCHSIAPDGAHGIGPNFHGVFDRPIGTADGFAYSSAMSARSGRWTERNLDSFLSEPQRFVPGTSMESVGLPNAEDREMLIAYLKSLR